MSAPVGEPGARRLGTCDIVKALIAHRLADIGVVWSLPFRDALRAAAAVRGTGLQSPSVNDLDALMRAFPDTQSERRPDALTT
ncbi:MAG: hypothetical protein AAF739_07510 [Pseudomonadota bacterium]